MYMQEGYYGPGELKVGQKVKVHGWYNCEVVQVGPITTKMVARGAGYVKNKEKVTYQDIVVEGVRDGDEESEINTHRSRLSSLGGGNIEKL